MDHSPILPMDNLTALPISTSGIGAPQAFGAHYFAAEVPKKIPAYRGKAITEADWPTLKPIIYRLYISEKLTFPKVKEALNVELGYDITEVFPRKRQFTRKIEEWGFRKNFRKDEREEIVKGGNIPQRFIHDSRINQKRVDRLQRRNGARMSVGSENHSSGMLSTQDRTLPKTTKIAEEDPGSHDTITEEIPTSNSPGDTIITGAMVPWTSNQAADNSSRLSRLTESSTQLEIKKPLQPQVLTTGMKMWKKDKIYVEGRQFMPGTELKELQKPYGSTLACGGPCLAQQNGHYQKDSCTKTTQQGHNSTMPQSHWSPILEIDIFPTSINPKNCAQKGLIQSCASLKRESREVRE